MSGRAGSRLNETFAGCLAFMIGNGNFYSAQYDALGRCITRSLNGRITYYTYDGQHPICEWNPDGTNAGWNLYGQGIDEILLRGDYVIVPNGQGYFFQQNRLGSVTHLTGFAGELIEKYRYDAFGAPTTVEPILGYFNNRFRFTGREYLEAFGIYEYRNRAYHPGLGRFLSEDPLGFGAGDTNMFRYCGGDPVNSVDPSGLDQNTITAGYGIAAMFTWGTNNGQFNMGLYIGVGIGASYSYTPATSEYVFPGDINGIAYQYTEGIGKFGSVNISGVNAERESVLTATAGGGYKGHQVQWGVAVDFSKSPPYSAAPISYGYLDGLFVGFGSTTYYAPKAPPPGGTTYVDPSICPECATMERVVVEGTPVSGIDDIGGGNAGGGLVVQAQPVGPSGQNYGLGTIPSIGGGQAYRTPGYQGGFAMATEVHLPGGGGPYNQHNSAEK
jgi:RHS repeat-associated protein